jgi:hypothetical protein
VPLDLAGDDSTAWSDAEAVAVVVAATAEPGILGVNERAVVAGYLYGAAAVMYTTATMLDVMDAERGEVVPLTFRTDGEYVWPEAVAYYVDQHGLAPYRPLLDAIRSADYHPRSPDAVSLFRAENALFATE